VPIAFVIFVLLHIPLCYWFVGMLKKRRAKKDKVSESAVCVSHLFLIDVPSAQRQSTLHILSSEQQRVFREGG